MALRLDFTPSSLHLQPVRLAGNVVSQERGRLVEIYDDNVEVAVVIEVTERAPAAAMRGCHTGTSFGDQLFKHALAQISENRSRSLVWVLG